MRLEQVDVDPFSEERPSHNRGMFLAAGERPSPFVDGANPTPSPIRHQLSLCGEGRDGKGSEAGKRILIPDGFQLQHPKGGSRTAMLVRIRTINECCYNQRMLVRIRTNPTCATPVLSSTAGHGPTNSLTVGSTRGPSSYARQRRPFFVGISSVVRVIVLDGVKCAQPH